MANVEKLKKVLAQIQARPDLWDQTCWVKRVLPPEAQAAYEKGNLEYGEDTLDELTCGTAGCFAGWACFLEGWKPYIRYDQVEDSRVEDPNGRVWDAPEAAAEILDLSFAQRRKLFDVDNELADLVELVEQIEKGELE